MIIEGYFPVLLDPSWTAWGQSSRLFHPSHKIDTMLSGKEKQDTLGSFVNNAIVRDSYNFITANKPVPPSHYGPFGCVISGDPFPQLPTKFFTKKRRGVSNSPFQQKVRNGTIVVSPLVVGQIRADYANGITDLRPPKASAASTHPDTSSGLFETEVVPGRGAVIRCGSFDITTGSHSVKNLFRKVQTGINPYQVGWSDQLFVQMLQYSPDRNSNLITECTGDANRGTLDILTAAAELPETVLYIMNLCKDVLRLYKDAKARELRLNNKIKRISNDRNIQNALQRAKDIKDILDAIASVWLQYRYAIMPNVYLIEDIIKTNESIGQIFQRYRKFQQVASKILDDTTLPAGWTINSNGIQDAHRVCIKRKFYPNKDQFSHLVSANLFVTAWEIVPLSFVVDWFVNIGDTLSALLPPPHTYEEGATISWKISGNVSFVHTPSNATVTATVAMYERIVINPSDYCRLNLNVDLNTYRMYDAFALSWRILTQNLNR